MPTQTSILIVDDDESVRLYFQSVLSETFDVHLASTSKDALEFLQKQSIDIVLLDLVLEGDEDGISILKKVKEQAEDSEVVIVSGIRNVKTVVDAMKAGAIDYLNKPIEKEELFLTLQRVLSKRNLRKQNEVLKDGLDQNFARDEIVGASKEIQTVKSMISRLKEQEVNVFLVGETGTGKEVFSRLLHKQEGDPGRPFISVNCAAIPQDLLESVLFGHEKGSFTGATETRIGKFELANGGDIFLDEISSLNLDLQAKLLRVLEEKEVERVGGKSPKKVSFRVISACNEDIVKKVAQGEFRSDLFYRLNTVTIQLPSLNDRREDIIPLAEFFLRKFKRTPIPKVLSQEVKEILQEHNWRGNVRELRNTIENMLIFSQGNVLSPDDIPFMKNAAPQVVRTTAAGPLIGRDELASSKLEGNYEEVIRKVERELILKALEKNRWSKTRTCRAIGISRNKLYRKLEELGIE
jgi:DNA-binding NtrC family response regulator